MMCMGSSLAENDVVNALPGPCALTRGAGELAVQLGNCNREILRISMFSINGRRIEGFSAADLLQLRHSADRTSHDFPAKTRLRIRHEQLMRIGRSYGKSYC
jgi:hypothetical protein